MLVLAYHFNIFDHNEIIFFMKRRKWYTISFLHYQFEVKFDK